MDLSPFWALEALEAVSKMAAEKKQCFQIPSLKEKEAPPLLTSEVFSKEGEKVNL